MRKNHKVKYWQKKLNKLVPVCVLSTSFLFNITNHAFAAERVDLYHTCGQAGMSWGDTSKPYNQTCVKQHDGGDRTGKMYDTVAKLTKQSSFKEKTNWGEKVWQWPEERQEVNNNFITLGYIITPSQEQGVLDKLNQISKDNVKLPDVLAALNGLGTDYIEDFTKPTSISKLDISQMNVKRMVQAEIDPNAPQSRRYTNEFINRTDHDQPGQLASTIYKYTSSKTISDIQAINIGFKQGLKMTIGASAQIPNVGGLTAQTEVSLEANESFGYTHSAQTFSSVEHAITTPSTLYTIKPHTGLVVTTELGTPTYKATLLGETRIKGLYTNFVNSYDIWIQQSIYLKFKLIASENPAIWSKLQALGFSLDEKTKEVIYKGSMNYTEHGLPAIKWSVKTQEYQLTTKGTIDYMKPIGNPTIKESKCTI